MNMLKTLMLVICTSLISYWIGAKVGFDKAWIYSQSLNTHTALSSLTSLKVIKFDSIEAQDNFIDDTNRLKIKEGLIEYGKYINKWTSSLPAPNDVRGSIIAYYEDAAKMYIEEVARKNMKIEPPEETLKKIELEMMREGDLDEEQSKEIWKVEKYVFLESLKEKEFYINSAISSLIKN